MSGREVKLEDFYRFVKSEVPEYDGDITLDTRVGEDLKLVGDDASDFLERFSEKFSVDLSALNFSDYFPSEVSADMHFYLSRINRSSTSSVVGLIRRMDKICWSLLARKKSFRTMTLGDVYLSTNLGAWIEKTT